MFILAEPKWWYCTVVPKSYAHDFCLLWLDHDDVIKWKHFPRYWSYVWGIHRSPVNSSHKGQWRRALMFSLIYIWINGWANNRKAGDSRRHHAHHDVTVMLVRLVNFPCILQDSLAWGQYLIVPVSVKQLWRIWVNRSYRTSQSYKSMGQCKKDVTPLLMHWSYVDVTPLLMHCSYVDVTPLLTHWGYVDVTALLMHWSYTDVTPLIMQWSYVDATPFLMHWSYIDVTPLVMHWSYIFLALTYWNVITIQQSKANKTHCMCFLHYSAMNVRLSKITGNWIDISIVYSGWQ